MDDAERAMLLDVYRGHVTAADAIARRLDIVPRDVKLRRAVVSALDGLLGMQDAGLRDGVQRTRDEYARSLRGRD